MTSIGKPDLRRTRMDLVHAFDGRGDPGKAFPACAPSLQVRLPDTSRNMEFITCPSCLGFLQAEAEAEGKGRLYRRLDSGHLVTAEEWEAAIQADLEREADA